MTITPPNPHTLPARQEALRQWLQKVQARLAAEAAAKEKAA